MARVPDNLIDALRRSGQVAIFTRMDTDDPLRLCLAVNDMPNGIESVDPDTNQVYLGGILKDVPALEAVINGVADRVEFQLSGIDPAIAAKFDIDEIDVRGRDFHVGFTTLDDYYQPMSSIIPLTLGRASFTTESQPPVKAGENPSVTWGLSVGFGITTRDRNSAALWSSVHHKASHPGDLFCDGTARLERGANTVWPRF